MNKKQLVKLVFTDLGLEEKKRIVKLLEKNNELYDKLLGLHSAVELNKELSGKINTLEIKSKLKTAIKNYENTLDELQRKGFKIEKERMYGLEELSEQFAKIDFDSAADEFDDAKEKLTNFKYYLLNQV